MAAGAKPSATTTTTITISDHLLDLNFFQFTKEVFIMERGPRYKAYADLRESKLRLKSAVNPPPSPAPAPSLPTKDHRSTNNSTPPKIPLNRRKGSSILAQSVPDFSSVLRKENRRPPPALSPVPEKSATPPAKSSSRLYEINARLMGSKSSISGEKRGIGNGMRKSYANMEELKKFSLAASNAINGENKGGRITGNNKGGGRTTVLGCRQYY